MANRYWVGGTGNWDVSTTTNWSATSGGGGGASVPTTSDDVFFDSASNATAYTVTITATANCANFTMAAPASGKVTWAGSSALNISGSMNLSGGTAGITRNFGGAITFNATSTGKTITCNGIVFGNTVTFNGVGGGWTLQDAWSTTTTSITSLLNGTLNTNGQSVTCDTLTSNSGSTRSLILGTSTVTARSGVNFSNVTNFTFSAASSTININSTSLQSINVAAAGVTFGTVTCIMDTGSALMINGANTFGTLTITGGASKTGAVTLSANQTITGTFSINGNSSINRLLIQSGTVGTARTITAATVSASNVDFADITGAGAASWNLSAITGLSGDCGGNSGITFTTATTQNFTNTSGGSWETAGNWTSRVPLPQDTAAINTAFTSTRTVTSNMPRLAKDVTFAGATWSGTLTLAFSGNSEIYGSLTLISGLLTSFSPTLTLKGRGSHTIDTYGVSVSAATTIGTISSSSYTLLSNFVSTNSLSLFIGTFDASTFNVTVSSFTSTVANVRTLSLGSGLWTISASSGTPFNVNGTNLTMSASTATIKYTDTGATGLTFAGGGKVYPTLWLSRGTSAASNTITGSNTFTELKDTGSVAHSLLFTSGTTTTITTFTVSGTAGNLITIDSAAAGTHTLVKSGGGTVGSDYLNIQDSIATPSPTWYAGTHSTNSGNNSGWTFTDPVINASTFFQLF